MSGHTPGPWALCPSFAGNEAAVSIVGDDSLIATVWDRDAHGREHDADANAAFIVRACNSHYELLQAVMGCWALLQSDPTYTDSAIKEMARAAIAKATGAA